MLDRGTFRCYQDHLVRVLQEERILADPKILDSKGNTVKILTL